FFHFFLLTKAMASKLPVECLRRIFEEITSSDKIVDPFSCSDAIVYSNLNHLHSCVLVNRTWCATAMPILWKDPIHWITAKENKAVKQVIVPWKDALSFYTPFIHTKSVKLPL